MSQQQTCLLVLGMHRSGTSALSGVLDILGVNMGKELMPASSDNQKGFFENRLIKEFNENILSKHLNTTWYDINLLPNQWAEAKNLEPLYQEAKNIILNDYSDSDIFGIKDPRMSIFLPFWEKIFIELNINLKIIIPYRNPIEVANSLKKRNKFTFERSFVLWVRYMMESERNSRNYPRVLITFDQLLSNSLKSIETLKKGLDISFPKELKDVENNIIIFLDNNLKNNISSNELSTDIPVFLANLNLFFIQMIQDDSNSFPVKKIDKIYKKYQKYSQYFNHSQEYIHQLKELEVKLFFEIQKRDHIIKERNQLVEQVTQNKNSVLAKRDEVISSKNQLLKDKDDAIARREAIIQSKNEAIDKRDKVIGEKNQLLSSKDEAIAKREAIIQSKNEAINKRDKVIGEKNQLLKDKDDAISRRNVAIQTNKEAIEERDRVIVIKDKLLKDSENKLQQQAVIIQNKEESLQTKKSMISKQEKLICDKNLYLQTQTTQISLLEETITQKEQSFQDQHTIVTQQNKEIQELHNQLHTMQQSIAILENEYTQIYTSRSYRIMRILRHIKRKLKGILSK